jgi:serine/threonine protein kinase
VSREEQLTVPDLIHPLKIKLSNDRKIILYFTTTEECQRCLHTVLRKQGFNSQIDQY